LRPFLSSPTGAQYSYKDHTSHVFLGTQKITCMGSWTAEHKKIDLWAAICDKFENHYIADCNALNIKSNSKTTYQVKIYILGIMMPIFFIIFPKNVLLLVLLQFKVTHKWLTDVEENYLKIIQTICLSSAWRCYTRISEHLLDINIQLPDPGWLFILYVYLPPRDAIPGYQNIFMT
jgi:hypothetical protein